MVFIWSVIYAATKQGRGSMLSTNPITTRRREMTIEWREENGLLGQVSGLTFFHIHAKPKEAKYYIMSWCDKDGVRLKDYFPTLEEAKAKAEQLFNEWKEAAGLISRSDITSCDKCDNSGRVRMYPDCEGCERVKYHTCGQYDMDCDETKPCPCLKDSHSLASIERAVKEEGR
jgi:hypothetical protein